MLSRWVAGELGTCTICRTDPAIYKCVLTDPLIITITEYLCADCKAINDEAVQQLRRDSPRLGYSASEAWCKFSGVWVP